MARDATDLAARIQGKTLELLLEKEPEEISMRNIANACGVTATSLYYYYRDKDTLFIETKLDCIDKMNSFIAERVTKQTITYEKRGKKPDPLMEIRTGLEAFRDWAFENPRIALLVMSRLKVDTDTDTEKMNKYYQSTFLGKAILDRAVKEGVSDSADTLLNVNLGIAALWGAIEMVLLDRVIPQYCTKRGAMIFTNEMIGLLMSSLTRKNRKK